MSNEDDPTRSTALRYLMAIGKARGFVTYDEVDEHMPESIVTPDEIDAWLSAVIPEGVEVVDTFDGAAADETPRPKRRR
jgi:RNA polymerase primary sigma factor